MINAKPRPESERAHVLQRRTLILGGAQAALVLMLAGRLYYLQIVQSREYALLAEENRINLRLSPPLRGRIIDRYGVELANNRRNFRVLMVAEQANDVRATLQKAAQVIGMEESQISRLEREIRRRPRFTPVMMTDNVEWEEFAALNVLAPELPGILLEAGQTRNYPFGPSFAHVLGYVGPASETDIEAEDNPILQIPGFRIGKKGIEKTHEISLRGEANGSQYEVNAYGRVIRELSRIEGNPGRDLMLTLDAAVQHYASQRMAGESAAAVIMDIWTGDILTLNSSPGFDPNWFNVGISADRWRSLNQDKYKPLTNKAVQGLYPPGSTFKMIVALAALEDGIRPDHRVHCAGGMDLGGHYFHCWKRGGHGSMDVIAAIEQSCDTFFYDVARRLGPEKISAMAARFGLGQKYDLGLSGERAGLLPTRAWKERVYKQPWNPGETLITGIGQGYVLASPLQLAVMTARIANGGLAVEPRLIRVEGETLMPPPSIGINPDWLAMVQRGMIAVTEGASGTARGARIQIPGQQMAGKTGTSQVRRLTMRDREMGLKPSDMPWEHRDHALFVGYAPIDAPRYAVSVIVEHGIGGSKTAAPIARDLLIELQRLEGLRAQGADPQALAQLALNPKPASAGQTATAGSALTPQPAEEESD